MAGWQRDRRLWISRHSTGQGTVGPDEQLVGILCALSQAFVSQFSYAA